MLDGYAHRRAVELRRSERQAWITVQILDAPLVQKRIFRKVARVGADPDNPGIRDLRRQVADPARQEIEDGSAQRQYLAIETGYRGDGCGVDMADRHRFSAGRNIEPITTLRQECGPRNERHIPLSSQPF